MKKEIAIENQEIGGKEIDLIDIVRTLISKRIFIIKVSIVLSILGLFHALSSPVEFQTQVVLLPEIQENSPIGSLSGIAGLAGLDLEGFGSEGQIDPTLYPKIIKNVQFLDSLSNSNFYFAGLDQELSLKEYLEKHSSTAPLGYVKYLKRIPRVAKELIVGSDKKSFGGSKKYDWEYYSKDEIELFDAIEDRITISIDDKTGLISIYFKLQDPVACAAVNHAIYAYLKDYLVAYRTQKERENLDFIETQLDIAKVDFYAKQKELAFFRDKNINITKANYQSQEERLESEYNIAFDVFNGLAQQREQAKISVQKVSPIFSVLKSITIPSEKEEPRRLLILVIFTLLGVLLGSSIVFLRSYKLFPE